MCFASSLCYCVVRMCNRVVCLIVLGVIGFVVLASFTSSRLFYALLFCMVVVLIMFPSVLCIVIYFCTCVRSLSFHMYYGMRDVNAYVLLF